MMSVNPVVIIAVVALFIVIAALLGLAAAKKRREALSALAAKLGLSFNPANNRDVASRLKFIDALRTGSNQYAFNILSGTYKEHEVMVFDFHYETHSTDSKGNRQTHHHYFSFFVLFMPRSFPELKISAEGVFSKIAQALGYDDIDFESHEFSRKYCVRSKDRKFAYDVCNARMMDYLLNNQDISIEIEANALAIAFSRRLDAEAIEYNLGRLVEVRELLPGYLFDER